MICFGSVHQLRKFGGGGGNRTHVRKKIQFAAYVCSLWLSSSGQTIQFCETDKSR